ncbi:fungal-specific transcription factor domain-containing protein [Dichomitus squalens]|uniref:Fungal-specific transcription factor domain-containing protein n=1 Tax=Dichomitus squalens TaxID=114155 RepID=A0A4Q9MFY4_9APHY|nr:fungal-specific transcription factor domain-containing protein [Dichomitus squalens]
MPLSARPRQDGENKERTVRSQEQELKRARGAISCAECRRLKLKCDKTVPCSSCKRRGCASICPNGSLTTGQGTRFILADTDRLHRKIAEMSDRIRQLEDGLAILQSSVTREPHPLLANDLLKIKSGLELHAASELELQREREGLSGTGRGGGGGGGGGEEEEEEPAYIDAFGTLAVRDDGAATFYGRSAGSESLLIDDKPQLSISTLSRPSPGNPDLPPEMNRLASTFPHGPPEVPIYDLQDLISGYLPPWHRAVQLRELYLDQAPWFFGAVTQRQLYEEVFPLFYEEAQEELHNLRGGRLGASPDAFNLPQTGAATPHASSHELALMFVVFCFGALTDATLPPAPHNREAERYYQLTKAALSLEPVLDRPPSVATVQVLSLMGIYMGMVAEDRSIESTWALMGLASKLAQGTGLHRDCARFKLSSAETQKRRALFWELFITDCWQALATGRLPTFELDFVDTELPADPEETLADDGTPQPSFPAWKARWGKECVAAVVMGVLKAAPPKYSVILELDRRIRDMPLPKYAQGPRPQNAGLAQMMSHYMPTNYLHFTLLYVHRVFFAAAVNDHPNDPMRSQYAPSFLAGYRSATALLSSVREQFSLFPTVIARFWVIWTHAFSACIMLGSVVTHSGPTKTAQAALAELRIACDLFERAAQQGGRATKFVPQLRKVLEKAQAAHFQGLQPLRPDIFAPRSAENEQDELSIFSGRTARTVATKSNRPQRVSPGMSASSTAASSTTPSDTSSPLGSGSGSDPNARGSQSPADVFPGLDSSYRTAVHPSLVAELRSFEGQLEAQISHANTFYHVEPSPVEQQQQQHLYAEQHQPQQPQQLQTQQLPPPQQQQMAWYQNAMPMDTQQQSFSTSQPGVHGSQGQAFAYPQPQTEQHTPEYHHTQEYAAYHHQVASDPHSLPLYGGAYSKEPAVTQYQNAFVPVPVPVTATTASSSSSSQSVSPYAAYATHAMPDQQSELWPLSAAPPDSDMAHPTSPMYETTPEHAHVPHMHPPSHQGHYRQYHPGAPAPQPLQPQHTGHGLQPQHTGQSLQPQHTGQTLQPQHTGQTIQPQHTGPAIQPQYTGSSIQPHHTGQMHHGGHHQHQHQHQQSYTQDAQYAYSQQQATYHQPQQQQQLPAPSAAPYNVQPGAPYSLTETWTSFIQHELPGPPGAPVRR